MYHSFVHVSITGSKDTNFVCSERGVVPLSGAVVKKFPPKITSHLVSWKRVTYEDVSVLPHVSNLITAGLVKQNDMVFTAVLERRSGQQSPLMALCYVLL